MDNTSNTNKNINSNTEDHSGYETDVILVVKGAGDQKADEHLNFFLSGFWPAVISLYPKATIHHRHAEDPNNEHENYTEILPNEKLGEKTRRIWIKESYWEPEIDQSVSPLSNIMSEWRMSSFAFGNLVLEIIANRDNNDLKQYCSSKTDKDDKEKLKRKIQRKTENFWGYYIGFFLLFNLVFQPFALLLNCAKTGGWLCDWLPLIILISTFLIAISPAYELRKLLVHRMKTRDRENKEALRSLPALPGWTFWVLLAFLIINPGGYILWLLVVLYFQITLLVARRIIWDFRVYSNSDTDTDVYYEYDDNGRTEIGRLTTQWHQVYLSPCLYRYLVLLTLPLVYIIWVLITFFKWTKILSGFGDLLEGFVRNNLTGRLGDVVNYAMDPSQAHRIRSVIEEDIEYFSNERDDVERIHILAHSQGTPITYETIFHYLSPKNQRKLCTYCTIGSVLSYYHQARGVLDAVYHRRFPVPKDAPKNFHDKFKWINFWNFTDPITEFYGLDDYVDFDRAPWKEGVPLDDEFRRSRTSPVNIKTRDSIAKNHGEYWSNLEKVQIPLAERVLAKNDGEYRPAGWNPDELKEFKILRWTIQHHILVLVLWILLTIGIPALFVLLYSLAVNIGLVKLFNDFIDAGKLLINELQITIFPPTEQKPLIDRLLEVVQSKKFNSFWDFVGSISIIGLVIFVVFDFIIQIIRVFDLGKIKGRKIPLDELDLFNSEDLAKLKKAGIHTNHDLVQFAGPEYGRNSLAKNIGLEEDVLWDKVCVADLMRIYDLDIEDANNLHANEVLHIGTIKSSTEEDLLKNFDDVQKDVSKMIYHAKKCETIVQK